MEHILVTGATGNVGAEVVRGLIKVGAPVRAADINVDRIREMFGDQVEALYFDFAKPETYHAAFEGVRKVFLMRPPAIADVQGVIAPAVWAMVGAGVEHVVFLSLVGVEQNRFLPHHKIEALLTKSGMHTTFLRASFFMQNLTTQHRAEIQQRHEIAVPAGRSKTSFIDVRDIAAVAVKALTEPGHADHNYTLTGSEALDYQQVAALLTEAIGAPVRYTNPSPIQFVIDKVRAGTPLGFALIMTMLYTLTRLGMSAEVSPQTQQLLGRPPITLRQFVQDYRQLWV